jgi:hypothetical protein
MQSAKSLRSFILNLVLTSSIFFPLLQGCDFKNRYGADTAQQVVEQYLLALENKDEKLMLKLISREYSAKEAVKDKINRLGGHKIQEYKVTYTKPKPVFLRAKVQGFYTNHDVRKRFDDTLTIVYQGESNLGINKGRWYLVMGKGNIPTPEVQPAEPQTSPPRKSS